MAFLVADTLPCVLMIADMMTKGPSEEQFEKLRLIAGMAPINEHPESSAKEC